MADAGGGHSEPRGDDLGGGGMAGAIELFLSDAADGPDSPASAAAGSGDGAAAGGAGDSGRGATLPAAEGGLASGSGVPAALLSGSGDGAAAGCSDSDAPSAASVAGVSAAVVSAVVSGGAGLPSGGVGARLFWEVDRELFCEGARELPPLTADARRDGTADDESPVSAGGSAPDVAASSSSLMAPPVDSRPDWLDGRRMFDSETKHRDVLRGIEQSICWHFRPWRLPSAVYLAPGRPTQLTHTPHSWHCLRSTLDTHAHTHILTPRAPHQGPGPRGEIVSDLLGSQLSHEPKLLTWGGGLRNFQKRELFPCNELFLFVVEDLLGGRGQRA